MDLRAAAHVARLHGILVAPVPALGTETEPGSIEPIRKCPAIALWQAGKCFWPFGVASTAAVESKGAGQHATGQGPQN